MSLKQEIETWVAAIEHYDNNEFEEALTTFDAIADTSKILFNCGMIHATLGEHAQAVECFQRATERDHFLSIAYFQQGVSNFLMGDFEEALANFNDALLFLRGNRFINYEQLGLKYKLHSCEVLFNRGLCHIYLQQKDVGMNDLQCASAEKETKDHDVIDEAIEEGPEDFTVFSIGVGIIYRPNSAKVKNLKARDYLGKARLVAQVEQQKANDMADTKKRAMLAAAERAKGDRQVGDCSFEASHLVHPHLTSRTRQQSEPPIQRNVFPPTPPPENEEERLRRMSDERLPAHASNFTRTDSVPGTRSTQLHHLRPQPLQIPDSSFTSLENRAPSGPAVPTQRIASSRSLSERPTEARKPRRLFMETTPVHLMPGHDTIEEVEEDHEHRPTPAVSQHRRTNSHNDTTDVSRRAPIASLNGSSRTRAPSKDRHFSIVEEDDIGHKSVLDQTSPQRRTKPYETYIPTSSNSSPSVGGSVAGRFRTQSERPHMRNLQDRNRSQTRAGLTNSAATSGEATVASSPSIYNHRRHHNQADRFFDTYDSRCQSSRTSLSTTGTLPELKSLRVKIHLDEQETRYIMLSSSVNVSNCNKAKCKQLSPTSAYSSTRSSRDNGNVDMYNFGAFVDRISEKFKLSPLTFKLKIRDEEGDLITLADQDDWDLVLATLRKDFVATSPASTASPAVSDLVGNGPGDFSAGGMSASGSSTGENNSLRAPSASVGLNVMGKIEIWVYTTNNTSAVVSC